MAGCVRCDFATCAVGAALCFLLLPSERVAGARMGRRVRDPTHIHYRAREEVRAHDLFREVGAVRHAVAREREEKGGGYCPYGPHWGVSGNLWMQ